MPNKFENLLDTVSLSLSNQDSARQVVDLDLDRISSDPNNPRQAFDDDKLQELATSIEAIGVLQPITVRPAEEEGRFIVRYGDRRFRAAKIAGLAQIPAMISESGDEIEVLVEQVVENDQRADLSAGEMAAAVARLAKGGLKQHEISKRLGRPKALISMYMAVGSMPAWLAALAGTLAIRTVYELHQAWKLDASTVEAFVESRDGAPITRAEARALVDTIEGKVSAAEKSLPGQTAPAPEGDPVEAPTPATAPTRRRKGASSVVDLPPLRVEVDGRKGRLVLSGKVEVLFDGADAAEAIDASAIRPA